MWVSMVALIISGTIAWPERGASVAKRVKCRIQSTMKNDLLNSSLHILIYGPSANSKEVDQLLEIICNVYGNEKHKKYCKSVVLQVCVRLRLKIM